MGISASTEDGPSKRASTERGPRGRRDPASSSSSTANFSDVLSNPRSLLPIAVQGNILDYADRNTKLSASLAAGKPRWYALSARQTLSHPLIARPPRGRSPDRRSRGGRRQTVGEETA